MIVVNARRLIALCAFCAAVAACGTPAPRGYADQGVAHQSSYSTLNTPYYIGADPSHPRQRGSGGGP